MPLLLIVSSFLAGLLICNAVPHLVAGLRGEPFATPFAKPPGKGVSAPLVNFVWGWINLFVGLAILPRLVLFSPVMPLFNALRLSFALGLLLCGVSLAWHFGRVLPQAIENITPADCFAYFKDANYAPICSENALVRQRA